jgi:hypothetical protein
MGIEEREEVQAKGICNILNKIITESFPNLEQSISIEMQEVSTTPNRPDQKYRILKAVKKKKQITYKGKPIKIRADFSTETLKARRVWGEVF